MDEMEDRNEIPTDGARRRIIGAINPEFAASYFHSLIYGAGRREIISMQISKTLFVQPRVLPSRRVLSFHPAIRFTAGLKIPAFESRATRV